MNPWNKQLRIEFDPYHKECILQFYNSVIEQSKSKRKEWCKRNLLNSNSVDYLKSLYESGYGIKILSRELDLTYSRFRVLYETYLGLELRKGYDVVTKPLKQFRSDRVKKENNPWYDWCSKTGTRSSYSRGIQGYYIKKDNTRVWLRSTLEYIFAKWLDANNVDWKVEVTQYTLSNGETYRPDFFIYDNDKLTMIYEVKGEFLLDRRYKAEMFRNEFDTPLVIIDNITDYCDNYTEEKKQWKLLVQQNV